MISTSDFRKGLYIKMDNQLYNIVDCQHYKPGKGGAIMRTKLRNLRTGSIIDHTFRSGETVEDIYIEARTLQYMYGGDGMFHFMDTGTYEQSALTEKLVGDRALYLKEGMEVSAMVHDGRVIDMALPVSANLKIAETEPGVRGDTAKGGTKIARLETGATVQVPLFITTGELVRVDTRTGKYLGRA